MQALDIVQLNDGSTGLVKEGNEKGCSIKWFGNTENKTAWWEQGEQGLKVIDKIGRANICRMVRHSRHTLCEEINATVTELAKRNKEIVLGYSTNNNLELDANMKELIVKK